MDTEPKPLPNGALLLIGPFYAVIVVIAVLLLAAVQFRATGGSAYDTWRLTYGANRGWDKILGERLAKEIESYQRHSDSLNFQDVCLHLYTDTGKLRVDEIDPQILAEVKMARDAGKTYDKLEGPARCILRGFAHLKYDRSFYAEQKEKTKKDIDSISKAMTANNEQHADLMKGQREFLAFYELEKGGPWYGRMMVVTPYSLLVLLLVMLMGALGGMVRLLRDYGDPSHRNPAPSDYFVIPLIGLVVAIGGYVVSKTGLLLLSSTREDASLSPFMVALLGIVSGLLAKEVIDAIARAGARMVASAGPSETVEAGAARANTARQMPSAPRDPATAQPLPAAGTDTQPPRQP